jgi:hypothetical protein
MWLETLAEFPLWAGNPRQFDPRLQLLENSFVMPDAALADVPASVLGLADATPGAARSGGNGSVLRGPFVTA